MSLLLMEGFEARESSIRPHIFRQATTIVSPGRFGGYTSRGGGPLTIYLPEASDVVIVGAAVMLEAGHVAEFGFSTPGDRQMTLLIRNDRFVEFRRGSYTGTIVYTSSAPVMQNFTWAYVEAKCRISDVGGFAEMRVNGQLVGSYTGDTLSTTNASTTLQSALSVDGYWLDDVYVCNSVGSSYNDFLGDVKIESLVPTGNGAFSQLVGSDGNSVDNYLLVDELPGSETDHVQSAVVGARDTYQVADLSVPNGTILAVAPEVHIAKASAGEASAKIVERLANGVERVSAPLPASNLAWRTERPKTTDPEGAAWTVASVNAAQFGVEVA